MVGDVSLRGWGGGGGGGRGVPVGLDINLRRTRHFWEKVLGNEPDPKVIEETVDQQML